MFQIVWLGGPATVAFLLTVFTRSGLRRAYLVLAIGVVLGLVFIGWAYLSAPPDYAHSQGDTDGQMFLGRWWEPFFALFLAFIGYLSWIGGTAVGFVLNAVALWSRGGDAQP